MTREEALKILKEPDRIGYNIIRANDEETVKYNMKSQMALYMAIKVLEQDFVLDKIREEINGMYRVILKGTSEDDWAVKWNDCLDEVLQIIDKYKESEE